MLPDRRPAPKASQPPLAFSLSSLELSKGSVAVLQRTSKPGTAYVKPVVPAAAAAQAIGVHPTTVKKKAGQLAQAKGLHVEVSSCALRQVTAVTAGHAARHAH